MRALQHAVLSIKTDAIIADMLRSGKAWKCGCGMLNTVESARCERCDKDSSGLLTCPYCKTSTITPSGPAPYRCSGCNRVFDQNATDKR